MRPLTHVIVAGSPGALLGHAAGVLHKSGLQVTWQGQVIDTETGSSLLKHAHNIEVHNIHAEILKSSGQSWLSDRLPVYYDIPYPGPAEYLAKFDKPAVIADSLLPPFISLWQPYVDIVIDVQASEHEDVDSLERWCRSSLPREYLQKVASHYNTRYRSQLAEFAEVFQITNSELKHERFESLGRFLAEVFQPV